MRVFPLLISLSLALPYIGRADEPTVPAPATASATSGENITAAATVAGTATATEPPANVAVEKTPLQLKKEAAEARIKQYGVNGFKPEATKSGEILYCKKEAPVGSRFETKQCRTFEQIRDQALQGKEYLERMQNVVPESRK
jgi:hypothetical protein